MKKLRLMVVYGGLSSERDVSILSADNIIDNLDKNKYNISRIKILKNDLWEKEGSEVNYKLNPFACIKNEKPDVAFIVLHGKDGEDGKVQAIFDMMSVPYTGSGVLSSALAMDKRMTYLLLDKVVLVPSFFVINKKNPNIQNKDIEQIGFPCIVKPNQSGSSVGISLVKEKKYFKKAIQKALAEDENVLIQKYIKGREFTCAVIGNSGSKDELVAMPVVEIFPENIFFDTKAKYSGKSNEVCPANIPHILLDKIQKTSIKIHRLLGCDGLTRIDFIYVKNKLFFLEINTIPGATKESLAPKEAKVFGWEYQTFLDKQIDLALNKKLE